MRVLVDTCVLSEVQRPKGNARVRAALADIADKDLFLSVLTVGEIVGGIERLEPGAKRSGLEAWVQGLMDHHADRILPVDLRVAQLWGGVAAQARSRGVTLPAIDGLLAATALHYGLAVMTRNTGDFEAAGVRLINPWM